MATFAYFHPLWPGQVFFGRPIRNTGSKLFWHLVGIDIDEGHISNLAFAASVFYNRSRQRRRPREAIDKGTIPPLLLR